MMKKGLICLFAALAVSVGHAEEHEGYSNDVLNKASGGFGNIISAPLEIPKNIINTTNDSNILYGIFGGLLKGTVNTAGRLGVGLVDFVTAPIPTKPIVEPVQIWEDFDVDTQYGDVFRLPAEYEK